MAQQRIRAVFMRGGTSRALFFHERDLPPPGEARDRMLLAALGSPDPYGRQLDGLGGGISSLSKACVIGPPTRGDADVDYTFAQVHVAKPVVDYTGNCGNCSAAVGPFAVDEGLVPAVEGETVVRIHNTNTRKLLVARVPVAGGEAAVAGDYELPGVPGRGARIALDFLDPGGAATGRLLPTGRARDVLEGVPASLVDATNPMVFVRARDLGLSGSETPADLDADQAVGARLEALRTAGARLMGIPESAATPKIALVAPPTVGLLAIDGTAYGRESVDLLGRVISMGNCHRAFALTAAMCLAVAARIPGTVVQECAAAPEASDLRLGHPSGVLRIAATVVSRGGEPWAERVTVYRTARRLMEGFVRIP
jgi:hypothetical protein